MTRPVDQFDPTTAVLLALGVLAIVGGILVPVAVMLV
jgi:hypothetical protein